VCPEYEVPLRNTIASKIRSQASNICKDAAEKLKQVNNVALRVGFWLSVVMDSYMGIACHYTNEEWLFRSIILGTMEVHVSHIVKNILDLLESIESRVVMYITDNATNVENAVTHSGRNHICCAAHVLRLNLRNDLKLSPVCELQEKMWHVFGNFCMSRQAQQAFSKVQSEMGIPSNKLTQEVPTRCNSILGMLRYLFENQKKHLMLLYMGGDNLQKN
jgi:hypothetical protein